MATAVVWGLSIKEDFRKLHATIIKTSSPEEEISPCIIFSQSLARKLRRMKVLHVVKTVVVVVAVLLVVCQAQLNFSPGWGVGKRAGLQDGPCKPSEALMQIYKLVQSEAQKLADCEKFGSN